MIGFGDPYFNAQQAAEAEAEQSAAAIQVVSARDPAATVTRGIPLKLRAAPHTEDVDVAELSELPRLPDTRLELISVARALQVDPEKALYLGKQANEQNVETHGFVALPHCGLCDAWAGAGRYRRADTAGAGADSARYRRH